MKLLAYLIVIFSLLIAGIYPAEAGIFKKLNKPPLSEQWFGIYVDNDRAGFYRQKISESGDGFLMEGYGSVRIKVMGFSREASTRESYLVAPNMSLRSFEVEQTINGASSRLLGKISAGILKIKREVDGNITDKQFKLKGEIYPGPALNIYPMMHDITAAKSYKILTFDPEDIKIKEVRISVLGEDKTPSGQPALKLRNNLYPFVNNDIWMDEQGNTLLESVRDGLVTTKSEDSKTLGAFVGGLALAKKDLIYDFSLVRAEPPIKDPRNLKGLAVEISGWNDSLPLLQDGGQLVEKSGEGIITIKTGSALPPLPAGAAAPSVEAYLKSAEKIESDSPELIAKAKELANGKNSPDEIARALASWTADWLKDTVEDGGGALASYKSRIGNCQTHARLYTALARADGIPTRFVSGLVYMEGKGFLYHSWAESLLEGHWVAIDPTYNQVPADPTHLKFFEGHLPEDMAPIIAIIGRIKIKVLEVKY